jgi:hypothetical protein
MQQVVLLFLTVVSLLEIAYSEYTLVTTISASIPTVGDNFGSGFSLVMNGTTIIMAVPLPMAASFPNEISPRVEIFFSENFGETWSYTQSITCRPTLPSFQYNPFAIAFSDNAASMIIGSVNAYTSSVVSLYTFSNGMYLNSSIDLGCGNAIFAGTGKSVAISGDGVYTFVTYRNVTDFLFYISYTNFLTEACQCIQAADDGFADITLTTNFDGSTLIVGENKNVIIYTAFSYQTNSEPQILSFFDIIDNDISISLSDSILAIGLCGASVNIYYTSNVSNPIQILLPPPVFSFPVSFGCNVELSDDGMRLVVGSNSEYTFVYTRGDGGIYIFDSVITPPVFDSSYGTGGLSIINTPSNQTVILIGGPSAGIGGSGQIDVFSSQPATTPSSSSTPITPTNSNSNSNNSYIIGLSSGLSIIGGLFGSIIGYFLIQWFRKQINKKSTKQMTITHESSLNSLNQHSSTSSTTTPFVEFYST